MMQNLPCQMILAFLDYRFLQTQKSLFIHLIIIEYILWTFFLDQLYDFIIFRIFDFIIKNLKIKSIHIMVINKSIEIGINYSKDPNKCFTTFLAQLSGIIVVDQIQWTFYCSFTDLNQLFNIEPFFAADFDSTFDLFQIIFVFIIELNK